MGEPRGRGLPRKLGVLLAAIPLLAVLLADGALLARRSTPGSGSHGSTVTSAPRASRSLADAARADALRALLGRRSDAVLHHDRKEWLSTLDPGHRAFRRQQARVFANLAEVPLASWSYSFDPASAQSPNAATARYHAKTWAPTTFALHYRLRGFDPRPTNLAQFPTFVQRSGIWYLTSLSDFAAAGEASSRELWDYGRVVVVRRPRVLVLGHPGEESTMQLIAAEAAADIPRVTAVWGSAWARKVVVLVPATQQELSKVVADYGDLDHIAAVATAEVQTHPGRPDPVGDRVGINPNNWPKLSPLGRQIVLTHELTHVATRSVTGAAMPTWLAEGFADYVGYLGSDVPTTFAAQELAADVRAGRVPARLPGDDQFNGDSKRLSQAYEGAWLACRLIADRHGQAALVRFYRMVGTSSSSQSEALAAASHAVLHESFTRFTRDWRAFLRAELA
ncbi:MAG TPA: hypothetical protein VFH66_00135 [Mycobacteriales bacterium]|nr:hypothetical protein [Mycobacteriales bacterium]